MFTSIVFGIMCGFSFGYCVMDLIENRKAERRINEMLKDLDK